MTNPDIELRDLGRLTRLGVKGPMSPRWLVEQGVPVPAEIYGAVRLDSLGYIVRLGAGEFFLEAPSGGATIGRLAAALSQSPAGVYRTPREDATFQISGGSSKELFAQTCGIDFRGLPPMKAIFTRVAGVSCAILPEQVDVGPSYRLWLDPSYSDYLFYALAQIVDDLGGQVVGRSVQAAASH